MYCGSYTLVKWTRDTFSAHTLRCKCWNCRHCQPMRAAWLVRDAAKGKPSVFLTLTCNPERGNSSNHRARMLVIAWRQVLRKLRRVKRYKRLQYFVVMEKTKAGEPHLHILLRSPFINQRWLSDQMRDLIGAPIVYIEKIKSKRKIANYVAKYVGKAPHQFDGCKRYWRSLDWMHPTRNELKAQRDPETTFHLVTEPFSVYALRAASEGALISAQYRDALKARLSPGSRAPPGCVAPRRESVTDR